MNQCDEIRPLLSAQIDGELTPGEERTVSQHLSGCTDCQRQRELLGSVDGLVASNLEITADFRARLDLARRQAPLRQPRRWPWAVAAVAASLLLAVILRMPQQQDRIETQQVINPLVALQIIDEHEEAARRSLRDTLALEVRALKLEVQRADLDQQTHTALMKRVEGLVSKVEQLRARENQQKQEIDL